MADENLVLGNGNWATKAGKILGYRKANDRYYPIPFDVSRNTAVQRINSVGALEDVAANVAVVDFKKDFVPPADNSNYKFNGSSDYAKVENSDDLLSTEFALMFDFTPKSLANNDRFLTKGTTSNGDIMVSVGSSNNIRVLAKDTDGVTLDYTFTAKDLVIDTKYNIWVFLDYSAGTVTVEYDNADAETSGSSAFTGGFNSASEWRIAANSSLATFGNIDINSFLVFNTIPTTQERADISAGSIPEKYKGARGETYLSDFSSGVDTFASSGQALAGNIDGIGGKDDNLRATPDAVTSGTYTTVNQSTTKCAAGKVFKLTGEFYIPSSNTIIKGIGIDNDLQPYISGGANYYNVTADVWHPIDVTFLSGGYSLRIYVNNAAQTIAFTSNGTDVVYYRNLRWVEVGNTLNLSTGKGDLGDTEVAENGGFDTDTVWSKGTGWSIGSGVASCDGSQTAYSPVYNSNALEIGKTYKITFTVVSISAGLIRTFCGGNVAGTSISTTGTYTEYLTCAGNTTLYFEGDSDFVGTIDDVSVKEAPIWYDLDHNIHADIYGAALQESNNFGKNKHGILSSPVFKLSPAFSTYFLNSATPVTQTVTTLTKGVTYTVNCKGVGLILIEETGGNGRSGVATEVNSFTYNATETSVVITLVDGHSFEFVQMTNTDVPKNHVPTLGSTITRALDVISIPAADSTAYDFTSEEFSLEFDVNFQSFLGSPIIYSKGGWQTAGWYIQFAVTGSVAMVGSQLGTNQISSTDPNEFSTGVDYKVVFTRKAGSVRIYKNGEDITKAIGGHLNPDSASGSDMIIGSYIGNGYPTAGWLKGFKLHLKELTPSEVAAL